MKTGWEIKPLGWIALILLVGTVAYFAFYHNKNYNGTEGKGTSNNVP